MTQLNRHPSPMPPTDDSIAFQNFMQAVIYQAFIPIFPVFSEGLANVLLGRKSLELVFGFFPKDLPVSASSILLTASMYIISLCVIWKNEAYKSFGVAISFLFCLTYWIFAQREVSEMPDKVVTWFAFIGITLSLVHHICDSHHRYFTLRRDFN
jgi:hypothetical protein